MTKYREILRLTALGLSLRDIEKSLKVSRKTVVKVQKRADELSLSWPLGESLTDAELEQRMFPKDLSPKSTKRMPDFDYIRKELLKNGVNKKLLWTEYLEECSQNGDDALMYSQFCYYIQQNEQKSRATMHIPRKAGQQIEVDWADDPAKLIDPDTGEITEAWIFVGVMTYSQYAFVEAFINEQQKSWTTAHVHMYEFFGGVTPILVSDNAPIEMHMTSMADAFRNQMQDISMKEISFEDRFGMIVDIEYTSRKNSRLKRLIKNAEFEQPDATIASVDYGHNRKINRHLIERLATCEYITE